MWNEPTAELTRSLQTMWHAPAPSGPLRAGCYWAAQRELRWRSRARGNLATTAVLFTASIPIEDLNVG